MKYETKNYQHLIGLDGFSDRALETHFTLYQGYVNNCNKALETMARYLEADKADSPEFAEVKRRFGWEWNGMRLHEYYFGALRKDAAPIDPSGALAQKITVDFGSLANWEKEFRAVGAMRGIGWTVLCHDREADKLLNVWINEHHAGHLAGAAILLTMDVFEHAYMIDYGTKRADYIAAFCRAIDWTEAEKRFTQN